MRATRIKGKSIEAAKKEAIAILGGREEDVVIKVVSAGKPAMLGVIGGEEAEVEAILKEGVEKDGKQILQDILDKMSFVAIVDTRKEDDSYILSVRGEDMGRIIGKNGNTLKAFEVVVRSILGRIYNEKININIDAGDYREKRRQSLERLAKEVADEVEKTGKEKTMPHLEAADRRIIHMFLRENKKVTSFSQGEGRERRLVIAPKG